MLLPPLAGLFSLSPAWLAPACLAAWSVDVGNATRLWLKKIIAHRPARLPPAGWCSARPLPPLSCGWLLTSCLLAAALLRPAGWVGLGGRAIAAAAAIGTAVPPWRALLQGLVGA